MCGIVGFVSRKAFNELHEDLPAATASLAHRGPDDSGIFLNAEQGVGLGHRRLSIIDLTAAGHQPMTSDNGRLHIVFNGEIYNYREIRKTLEGFGDKFHSATDTEVILKSYQRWGSQCLERFIGMFAIAIWDQNAQSLFLARDRLGIKPLFYYVNHGIFLFASELKALMAFQSFPRVLDHEAISLFLHYQYIPAPRTVFTDTRKLEPGHHITLNGKSLNKRQWWDTAVNDTVESIQFPMVEKNAILRLDELLTQAVSDRLISDVPLGALLSGGVDSSAIVAIMQKVSRSPVRTFSIGFEDKAYNEAPWAKQIAKHLGTDHTELYVTSTDALNVIPKLPAIYDEPFADSSAVPTFLVSELTRGQVTVALSGDGGDEQFAGYVRYWMTEAMALWMKWLPSRFRDLLKQGLLKIPISTLAQLYSSVRNHLPKRLHVENFSDKWQKLVDQLSYSDLSELYRMTIAIWSREDIHKLTGDWVPNSTFERVFSESLNLSSLKQLMIVDRHTYLPDAMLTKVDRASMAASLEVRVPMLDHRVVEFTSRLPDSLKYRNGKGKYLLMELLCNYVPRYLVERPKMGFGIPIADWFRNDLKELLNDYLSTGHLKDEGLFDPQLVRRTLKEHQTGITNHQHRLWTLLMWEMWREKWLD
jgi:asparagine synthase (glutamine-hydrolysing)